MHLTPSNRWNCFAIASELFHSNSLVLVPLGACLSVLVQLTGEKFVKDSLKTSLVEADYLNVFQLKVSFEHRTELELATQTDAFIEICTEVVHPS